jgi:hypothetical protein
MLANFRGSILTLLLVSTPQLGANPDLKISTPGGGAVWLQLSEDLTGDSWILQDSYDASYWRDLASFDDVLVYKEGRSQRIKNRIFRAVQKDLDWPIDALNNARDRWEELMPLEYQYVYRNFGEFGLYEELVVVEDDVVTKSFTLRKPDHETGKHTGTITDLHNEISSTIGFAASVEVRYHPTIGTPETIFVDYDAGLADEEWQYEIIQPPASPSDALKQGRRLWRIHKPKSYQFHLRYVPGLSEWEGSLNVSESGAVTVVESSTAPPAEALHSIDELYLIMGNAMDSDDSVHLAFDRDSGQLGLFSRNAKAGDSSEQYWITEFKSTNE